MYIKPSLTYHGGEVFGKAIDQSDKLAKTICCIMVKCLYGSPEFVAKLLLVSNLTAEFLHSQVKPIIQAIQETDDGRVMVVITDGHQVNQKLFKCMQLNDLP